MFSPRKLVPPLAFFLAAGCLPALAQGYGKNSSFPGFDRLIELLGYDGLQGSQRDLMALLLIVCGLGFGYFSHLAFKDSGFGILLNAVVGLSGACLALFALGPKFGLLSQVQGRTHDFLLAVLVAGAAVPTLVLAMVLASMQRRAMINFVYGRLRRKMETERAAMIEPELPPRIAEMMRK
jgi:uncharacterized membrane protein YeaQ/YmgE (transglycosylase-associated protein family)